MGRRSLPPAELDELQAKTDELRAALQRQLEEARMLSDAFASGRLRIIEEPAPVDPARPHHRRLRLVPAAGTKPIRLRVPSSTVVQAAEELIEARRSALKASQQVWDLQDRERTRLSELGLHRAVLDINAACREVHERLERIIASFSAALLRAGIVPPADEAGA